MSLFFRAVYSVSLFASVLCITYTPVCKENEKPIEPEQCLFSAGIIRKWGYAAEVHTVVTADGYILTMFRIPYGKDGPSTSPRPVVLLQHGLMGSSDTWLVNLPYEGLAYILADAGYDVWIGNVRGNRYSRAHTIFNPNTDKAYWMFSWEQMAEYDLPAMIDYALMKSGQTKLDYIAHSQGTLIGFAKFCSDPEWTQQKIGAFYPLAPVWFLGHITSPLKDIAHPWIISALQKVFYGLGVYEFGTSDTVDEKLSEWFCLTQLGWEEYLCKNVILWIEGFNKKYTNDTRVPIYLSHTPAGTSVQNIIHFGQMIASGKVRKFDYGSEKNKEVYGQPTPPEYPIENLRVPSILFSGGDDSLADPTDVAHLISKISKALKQKFYYDDFQHLDFTYGLGAYQKVYPPLLHLLNQK